MSDKHHQSRCWTSLNFYFLNKWLLYICKFAFKLRLSDNFHIFIIESQALEKLKYKLILLHVDEINSNCYPNLCFKKKKSNLARPDVKLHSLYI